MRVFLEFILMINRLELKPRACKDPHAWLSESCGMNLAMAPISRAHGAECSAVEVLGGEVAMNA